MLVRFKRILYINNVVMGLQLFCRLLLNYFLCSMLLLPLPLPFLWSQACPYIYIDVYIYKYKRSPISIWVYPVLPWFFSPISLAAILLVVVVVVGCWGSGSDRSIGYVDSSELARLTIFSSLKSMSVDSIDWIDELRSFVPGNLPRLFNADSYRKSNRIYQYVVYGNISRKEIGKNYVYWQLQG